MPMSIPSTGKERPLAKEKEVNHDDYVCLVSSMQLSSKYNVIVKSIHFEPHKILLNLFESCGLNFTFSFWTVYLRDLYKTHKIYVNF